jgi:hypothetical protein
LITQIQQTICPKVVGERRMYPSSRITWNYKREM